MKINYCLGVIIYLCTDIAFCKDYAKLFDTYP